ncbi:MAG: EVE domain-containing protein [Syntrophobacteraceae bacterium]|jgi:predicted RNA-binding protein with PUA-like domain|nr:EVE domain-containing protein [Syntrophobacteraceae bacterium]
MRAERYWLLKSEPSEFSIDDLGHRPDRTEPWDGVRNYQARSFLRDGMKVGDRALFYHSGKAPAVVGVVVVVREGYPDPSAWDPMNRHFDPRSTPDAPVWYMVDVRLEDVFPAPLPLAELRGIPGLENMMLLRKGSRLSVQPVSEKEFQVIVSRAGMARP